MKTLSGCQQSVVITAILFVSIASTIVSAYRPEGVRMDIPHAMQGLYYYRGHTQADPLHDQGWFNTTPANQLEYVICGIAIFFNFNQPGDYGQQQVVENIYYHTWFKRFGTWTPEDDFTVGYNTTGGHQLGPDTITIPVTEYITLVDGNVLFLKTHVTNQEYSTFYDARNFVNIFQGNNPQMITSPRLTSFIIINVPDNETLNLYGLQGDDNDTDNDLVSDFDELYTLFTNPYDPDTDNDGLTDYEESVIGSDPNDYTDTGSKKYPDFLKYILIGLED